MKLKVDRLSLSGVGFGIFLVIFAQFSYTFATDSTSTSNLNLTVVSASITVKNSSSSTSSSSIPPTLIRHHRVKRDYDFHEGCVVGIRGHISPGEAEGANLGAFMTTSAPIQQQQQHYQQQYQNPYQNQYQHQYQHELTHNRKKRSLNIDIQKNLKLPGLNIPIPQLRFPRFSLPKFNFGRYTHKNQANPSSGTKIFTRTQKNFDVINHNVEAAELFLDIVDSNVHSDLSERILVSPSGITCEDICDINGQDGVTVGVGVVGVCTSDFCKCHESDSFVPVGYGWVASPKSYDELRCARSKVFDLQTLKCRHPKDTILCSDHHFKKEVVHEEPQQNLGYLRESEYGWIWQSYK